MRVIPRQQVHTVRIAGTFLDCAKVGGTADAIEVFLSHVRAHAIGKVIQQNRQIGDAIDGECVQGVFTFGGNRIGRRRHEYRIGANLDRAPGILERILGTNRTGTDDVTGAPLYPLLDKLHQVKAFLHALRVVFTGGACRNNAVYPGFDKKIDGFGEPFVVDTKVLPIRRNHRGINTFKFH